MPISLPDPGRKVNEHHSRRLLILSFSVINNDPRVMRQIRWLEHAYDLMATGFGDPPAAHVEFVRLEPRRPSLLRKLQSVGKLLCRCYDHYYWNLPEVQQAVRHLAKRDFDLVIANDVAALPVALRLAGQRPVLIDAHEYSPAEFEDRWWWRFLFAPYYDHLCRHHLPKAKRMATVCQGIAERYARHYGVSPVVILNAPSRQLLSPSEPLGDKVRLIHHGAAIRSRRLELMIQAMTFLDQRFTLDFMLTDSDPRYLAELVQMARDDHRIAFVQPVPMDDICARINAYDVGIFLLPPVNFNYAHALPNKFFEFIQARLAVVIGPSPEMTRILRPLGIGVVAKSFAPQDLAQALAEISRADLVRYKAAANVAAQFLNAESVGATFIAQVRELLCRADLPG